MTRRCVYTVLYGNTDRLLPQPVRAQSQLDFIAFTDNPAAAWPGWTCRTLPPRIPGDPARSARYVKFHPHLLLPEYDASLYVDATVLLRQPPEALFATLLDGHTDTMACLAHSHRSCVLDEVRAVLELEFDDPARCLHQMAAYAEAGWTGAVPLAWSDLLLRHHHHPAVIAAMQMWWEHVLAFSRRDQLSFAFVAEQQRLSFAAHAIDNEDSPFHQWPVPRDRARPSWRPTLPVAAPTSGHGFAQRLHALLIELELDISRRPQADLAAAQAETAHWRAALDATRASTSWRITAPLRRASTLLRPR